MKIVFLQSSSTSYSFLDYNESEVDSSIPSNCSLYLFGRALITRNIELINSMYDLETVFVPKKLNFISNIIKSTTDIPVEEIDENTYGKLAAEKVAVKPGAAWAGAAGTMSVVGTRSMVSRARLSMSPPTDRKVS
jgi:hypothetical protein